VCLQYPESDQNSPGKTTPKEDRYRANFLKLIPGERVLQSINFDTTDEQFQGEMMMDATLKVQDDGTLVTITFDNIPEGVNPEGNEKGTESSLQKRSTLF
jgi:hypothetical protein